MASWSYGADGRRVGESIPARTVTYGWDGVGRLVSAAPTGAAMRASEVAFVGALVHRFMSLEPLLQEHLDDYDGLLPHVFLGDVTRWIVTSASEGSSEVTDVLGFFEWSFARGGEHEQELIAVSFLENLPSPGDPGAEVRSQLGPALTRQLEQIG